MPTPSAAAVVGASVAAAVVASVLAASLVAGALLDAGAEVAGSAVVAGAAALVSPPSSSSPQAASIAGVRPTATLVKPARRRNARRSNPPFRCSWPMDPLLRSIPIRGPGRGVARC
jgi:hypothetical protein